jgi:glycosyltransferase involved in cell wall biosynthesis
VVANSYSGRRDHQRIGYKPRAFPVISNGIDTARFKPSHTERARVRAELSIPDVMPLVIHVARVNPMKDHANFLKVAAAMPDIRFAAIGRGTEALQVPPNVIRLGVRNDMPAVYAAADFLLSTSIFGEGFSNVIAEGMASGVPAVATDIGDAREILADTGSIVRPSYPDAMADALRRLVNEPEAERRNRANLCRERIETCFSLERAVASFDALYIGGGSKMPESTRSVVL